jgi:hypothetical protein
LQSCAVPVEINPSVTYRKDITIVESDKFYEGVTTLEQKPQYNIQFQSQGYIDLLTIETCHQYKTYGKEKILKRKYLNIEYSPTMIEKEKIRACYQHSCLKLVSNEKMTNQSLRGRFTIDDKNAAIASRIIKDTFEAGMIKEDDPENKSRKHRSYVPFWA